MIDVGHQSGLSALLVDHVQLQGGEGIHAIDLSSGEIATGKDFGNVRPVVDIGPDQTGDEGQSFALTAACQDPNPGDGSDFGFLWQVTRDGTPVVVSNPTKLHASFIADDNGVYVVTFTATDHDDGDSQYVDTLSIVVSKRRHTTSTPDWTGPSTRAAT